MESVYVCACVFVLVSVLLSIAAATEDRIVFPDQRESRSCEDCEVKIPLEMALRLNTITDEKQLFREFIKGSKVETPILKAGIFPLSFAPDSVSDRFGGSAEEPVERKALLKPKPAGCIPELKSVSLRLSEDPWIYYWPSCTRVEQCGGCCSHPLLKCQPVEIETLNFQVVVTEYVANELVYKGKEIVPIEKHTKCKCDCITKQTDCNPLQEYRKGECRCVCKNKDAEAKCNADNQTHHWNPENCSCECLNVFECSTGTYFSQSTCSCEPVPEESQLPSNFQISFEENTTMTRRPPSRRRWPASYLFGNGK